MPAKFKPEDIQIGTQLVDMHEVGRSLKDDWHKNLIEGFELDGPVIYLPFGITAKLQEHLHTTFRGHGSLYINKLLVVVEVGTFYFKDRGIVITSFNCAASYDDIGGYVCRFVPTPPAA